MTVTDCTEHQDPESNLLYRIAFISTDTNSVSENGSEYNLTPTWFAARCSVSLLILK